MGDTNKPGRPQKHTRFLTLLLTHSFPVLGPKMGLKCLYAFIFGDLMLDRILFFVSALLEALLGVGFCRFPIAIPGFPKALSGFPTGFSGFPTAFSDLPKGILFFVGSFRLFSLGGAAPPQTTPLFQRSLHKKKMQRKPSYVGLRSFLFIDVYCHERIFDRSNRPELQRTMREKNPKGRRKTKHGPNFGTGTPAHRYVLCASAPANNTIDQHGYQIKPK